MNKVLLLLIITLVNLNFAQNKNPQDFGYQSLALYYKNDSVQILIKSKIGEENIKKTILFFCQGSLPQPLIKYDDTDTYGVFPFNPDILTQKYHLVIVSKPYIPLMAHVNTLNNNSMYLDRNGNFVKEYSDRNLLDYYVDRNLFVIKYLQKQNWISSSKLIIAGHSEGSTIAAKMATKSKKITHLIYASGNPMGRIMSEITKARSVDNYNNSQSLAEQEINYWQSVVTNKNDLNGLHGDTNKATYQFSNPPILYLQKLKIPVLVSYGTKDWCAPFIDFMRVDFIRQNKQNFTFSPYVGTDHNFFPLTESNRPDYDIFNWDKVANDWLNWIN